MATATSARRPQAGETFNRRNDVWALAAVVDELLALTSDSLPALRFLVQGHLLKASPAAAARPGENVADATKVAALVAAVSVVDAPGAAGKPHPFGGLPAAWAYLARYLNTTYGPNNGGNALKKAALPALVAFLETAAFFLLKTYQRPFLDLLVLLETQVVAHQPGDADGEAQLAAANFDDLLAKARKGTLQPPDGFANFTAPN